MHNITMLPEEWLPDISIVLCTFNRSGQLKETITSVLTQKTTATFEVIVVDDGSTDDTTAVMHELAAQTSIRVNYVRQENSGVGTARNRGVAEARGTWIAFIDDDEIATSQWLEALRESAEQSGADCVGGPCLLRTMRQDADIQPVGTIAMLLGQNPAMTRRPEAQSLYERLRNRSTRLDIPGGGNALVRRTLVERLGGFRAMRYGEDLDFFRRAQAARASFAIAHDATVYHMVPPHRLTLSYLANLSARAGRSQAGLDTGCGIAFRPLILSGLRIGYMIALVFPSLVWNLLRRQKSQATSRWCSLLFSAAYVREVLRLGFLRSARIESIAS